MLRRVLRQKSNAGVRPKRFPKAQVETVAPKRARCALISRGGTTVTAVSGQTVARRAAMSAFIWTIGGLAVIGLLVGVGSSPILRAARPAAAHPVGESVPTTFGIVAVEHRELIA